MRDMEEAPRDGTNFIAIFFCDRKMSPHPHAALTARTLNGQFETWDLDRWTKTGTESLGGWLPMPEVPAQMFS